MFVFGSFFILDPFNVSHDDGLADLLFVSSGPTNASAFIEQNNPLEDSFGMASTRFIMSDLLIIYCIEIHTINDKR